MIPIAKPSLSKAEEEAVIKVLRSGMLALGEEVQKFEEKFSKYFGYKYTVATSSGTTALQCALWAHNIGRNDEVITTPFTFMATANTILAAGAKPVFVDIDPKTYNIDSNLIEKKITKKTKAIMLVHLYGYPCNMDKISKIAKKHNLVIIEDACQAHGAKFKGKYVGSWGTATFSLYPTKNMTSGEGGLLTTNNKKIAEKARLYRNHGQKEKYLHTEFGLNLRMTNIPAAIGIVQLKKLKRFTRKRQENARYYLKHLKGVQLPIEEKENEHVYHLFTVRVSKRRNLVAGKLNDAGIGTGIHYPRPIHKQPYYKKLGYSKESFPEAERAAKEVLSLPVHPEVTRKDLAYICKTFNKFVETI